MKILSLFLLLLSVFFFGNASAAENACVKLGGAYVLSRFEFPPDANATVCKSQNHILTWIFIEQIGCNLIRQNLYYKMKDGSICVEDDSNIFFTDGVRHITGGTAEKGLRSYVATITGSELRIEYGFTLPGGKESEIHLSWADKKSLDDAGNLAESVYGENYRLQGSYILPHDQVK